MDLLFFAAGILAGWKPLPWVLRWVSRFEAGTALLAISLTVALAYAYAAERAGLAGIIGAYLAGLMLGFTPMRGRITREVEHTAFAFFVPFFFVSVGLTTRFAGLGGRFLLFVVLLTLLAVITKLVGGGLGALLAGFRLRPALAVGAGMVARGEVGLIVASLGLEQGLIEPPMYSAMVIVSLVTTLVTPPLLRALLPRQGTGPSGGEGPPAP